MTDIEAPYDRTDFGILPAHGVHIPGYHEIMEDLRGRRPVAPVIQFGQQAWLITRHDLVTEGFRREDLFPSALAYTAAVEPVMGRTLQCMAGEEHRVNRALVSPAFRANVVAHYVERLLVPLAHELVDAFVARGEADLVEEFTHRLPFAVICRLLGLPRTDNSDFERWGLALLNFGWDPEGALRASAEYTAYLRPLLDKRRSQPADDLLSTLVVAEVEGRRLTDEEVFSFLRLLFAAGADTTYLGLGNLLWALLTQPDALTRVQAGDSEDRRWAIEELLRWESPVAMLPRACPEEVTFGGETVPAGSAVLLGVAAANRDPAVFSDPHRFDLGRRPQGHLAFGFGVHFCLGAPLARKEIAVALDVILERLPGLHLTGESRIVGSILRGPDRLDVAFEA